jgi:hypothetical protein
MDGHADIQSTMKYLHYESRKEDADLVVRAFRTAQVGEMGPERSYDRFAELSRGG